MSNKTHRIILLSIVAVFGLALWLPGQILAEPNAGSIVVNTTLDEWDLAAGTGTGCSLREAIDNINQNGQPQTSCTTGFDKTIIQVPAGYYTLTLNIGAYDDDTNHYDDLDISATIQINGDPAGGTVIQAGTENPTSPGGCGDCIDRVLEVLTGASAILNDVTIRYGRATDGPGQGSDGESGGGIFNDGTLTLNRSTVLYNRAGDGWDAAGGGITGWGGHGGGIYNDGDATLTLNDSIVLRNHAGTGGDGYDGSAGYYGGYGGGIFSYNDSSLTISDSRIQQNKAGKGGDGGDASGANAGDGYHGGYGGGIYCSNCDLDIDNSVIFRNNSGAGGNGGDASGGSFQGGDGASAGNGSGLFLTGADASLLMDKCTVSENESGLPGLGGTGSSGNGSNGNLGSAGGMLIFGSASGTLIANIYSSTFNDNTGQSAGGIYINDYAQIYMVNSTLSNNRAANNGGGLYLDSSTSTALLSFVTITENTADWDNSTNPGGDGGGFYNDGGNLSIFASIIANNSDKDFSNPDCDGTASSTGGNLFGITDSTGCSISPGSGDLTGTTASPKDPQLKDLADNGGPTETHALTLSSPAVDHITGGGCGTTYTEDQRGQPRFPPCDIGAYETSKLFLPLIMR